MSVIDLSEQDIPFESAQSIGGGSSRTQKDDKICSPKPSLSVCTSECLWPKDRRVSRYLIQPLAGRNVVSVVN